MMGDREDDLLAGLVAAVKADWLFSTFSGTSRQTKRMPALRISAPGSSRASVSTWKPLQTPSTATPRSAASLTARITGDCAAIAPERR